MRRSRRALAGLRSTSNAGTTRELSNKEDPQSQGKRRSEKISLHIDPRGVEHRVFTRGSRQITLIQ